MFVCGKKKKRMLRPGCAEVCKSPLQGMEKLSELTSILLTVFASSWRTGDKKRLGKSKNTNKANSKSDLRQFEVIYVSLRYTGHSEGYVNLEATPSSHSFPLSFCGLVGLFVCFLFQ